jgi:hypothetical protein
MRTRFAVILLALVMCIGAAQAIIALPDDLKAIVPLWVRVAAVILSGALLPAYTLIQHSPFGAIMDKADKTDDAAGDQPAAPSDPPVKP